MGQKGADEINRETIQQYFNLPQGDGSKMLVLDDMALETTLNYVKYNMLKINESALNLSDSVKLRRETYRYLKEILDRIDKVAKVELAGARGIVEEIYNFFDDDEIEEEDIIDVTDKIKEFYDEINKTQINIPTVQVDDVRSNVVKIEKAIESVGSVLNEKDTLNILLAFSTDPLSDLMPLYNLLKKVQKSVMDLDSKISSTKNQLGVSVAHEDTVRKYQTEEKIIANGLLVFEGGQF